MTTAYRPLFKLGKCAITHAAQSYLAECSLNPEVLLRRHVSGDWGEVPEEDAMTNDEAVKTGGRILSGYVICGNIVYVLTVQSPERERRTVIVLPGEL